MLSPPLAPECVNPDSACSSSFANGQQIEEPFMQVGLHIVFPMSVCHDYFSRRYGGVEATFPWLSPLTKQKQKRYEAKGSMPMRLDETG